MKEYQFENKEILKTEDLKELLGVGNNTVYTLMHSKGFPSIKIGGRYFVLKEDFLDWVREYRYKSFLL